MHRNRVLFVDEINVISAIRRAVAEEHAMSGTSSSVMRADGEAVV